MGSSGALTQRGHGDTQESSKSESCWVECFPALHAAADPHPSWFHSLGFLTLCLLPPLGSSSVGQGKQGWPGDPTQPGAGKAAPLLTSLHQMRLVRTGNSKSLFLSRGNPFHTLGNTVMVETDLKCKILPWNTPEFITDT